VNRFGRNREEILGEWNEIIKVMQAVIVMLNMVDTTHYKDSLGTFVGDSPIGISITPDGTTAYVTNGGSDSISVINTATSMVLFTIPLASGSMPWVSALLQMQQGFILLIQEMTQFQI
jgi:YVTN family beta-propeller protein